MISTPALQGKENIQTSNKRDAKTFKHSKKDVDIHGSPPTRGYVHQSC